jgi:hypothetical protein
MKTDSKQTKSRKRLPLKLQGESGLKTTLWPVYDQYVLTKEDRRRHGHLHKEPYIEVSVPMIERIDGAYRTIDLSDPNLPQDLIRTFCKIDTDTQCLDWVKQYGLLFDQPGIPFLMEMKELLGAAASLRWLVALVDAVKEAEAQQLFDKLSEWVSTAKQDTLVYTTFKPLSGQFRNYIGVFGCDHFMYFYLKLIEDQLVLYRGYPAETWRSDEDFWIVVSAKNYLQAILQELLQAVQLTFDWRANTQGQYALLPAFYVPTPWHAMCLEIYHSFARAGALKKCRNPSCTEMGAWPKNRLHCSGRCQKACERALGPTRKNRNYLR